MGNRPIAEYLIAQGARPSLFSAAMLGQLEVVKAFVAAQPTAAAINVMPSETLADALEMILACLLHDVASAAGLVCGSAPDLECRHPPGVAAELTAEAPRIQREFPISHLSVVP